MSAAENLEAAIAAGAARLYGALASEQAQAQAPASDQWATNAWTQLAQQGYPQAMAAEDQGGIAANWQEIWPLLHGLGRYQLALPLAETVVGIGLAAPLGVGPSRLGGGPLSLAWGGQTGGLRVEPAAAGSIAALLVSGRLERVAWASQAGHLLAWLPGHGLTLMALGDSARVQIESAVDAAGLPCDTLQLDQARAERLGFAPQAEQRSTIDPVLVAGAAARAIAMVGALESVLEQTVRYAAERVQFGRPIGRNQALQFQLAQLAGEVATARASARAAAVGLSSGTAEGFGNEALTAVAVAKLIAGEAAAVAIATGHQVHGAIGFTREHRLHRATHRLWAWRAEFGAESWWADRLGAAAIASGARGFWPALTDGSLLRS